MGKVVHFGLFFLGCFVFGSISTPVEEATDKQAAAKSYCPPGGFFFRNICYEYFGNSETWEKAEAACQNYKKGAHLVSFSSLREEKVVSAHIRSRTSTNCVWTGFNAVPEANQLRWEWSDGSPYTYGSALWDNRRPNTVVSSQECVALCNVQNPSHSNRWSQHTCETSWPYVCKYKPGY